MDMAGRQRRLTSLGAEAREEAVYCDPVTGVCYGPGASVPDFASVWAGAMTLQAYVAEMRRHQAAMQRRLHEVTLPAGKLAIFGRLSERLRVLVMTEAWCGDSLMNLPVLARIVDAAPALDLRVVARSDVPELASYYAKRGVTHIPVFAFLNSTFAEAALWEERPQAAHRRLDAWMSAHPEIQQMLSNPSLSAGEREQKMAAAFPHLLEEMERWYAEELAAATAAEIKVLLAPWLPATS